MNRPLGTIGRLGLGAAVAGAAMCVVLLASAVPARAAVELAYFYVTYGPDDVLISWGTGSERTTVGFNLYRTETEYFSCEDPPAEDRLNLEMIEATQFPDPFGDAYYFVDQDVDPGVTYYYWLEVVDTQQRECRGPAPEATPTPTRTSTSTSTPTATATSARTATSTPRPAKTPTPTSTSIPTVTPSFTATGAPTSTPTATAAETAVLTPLSSPSPTPEVEQRLSPTETPGAVAQPALTPSAVYGEATPMPTSTTVAQGSETSTATVVAWGGNSEPEAPGRPSFGVHLPTVQPSTVLLFVSLMSLLGALLLSAALALVHKLSL